MSAVDLPSLAVKVSINGRQRNLSRTGNSKAGNLRFTSEIPGGYTECSFLIDDSERIGNTNVYKFGARVTVTLDSGPDHDTIVWQGVLNTPVKNDNGTCTLTATGYRVLLEERDDPMLWLTYDGWADMDSPPFEPNFNNSDNIDSKASPAEFKVAKGTEILVGDLARLGWWFPDHVVRYVAWSQTTNRDNPNVGGKYDYSLKLERYANGAGNATVVQDLSPTGAATGVAKSVTISAANAQPMVALRFAFEGTAKKDVAYTHKLRGGQLRVGDRVQADTFKSHEVMQDIGGILKLDVTSRVNTGSSNAMPYWHQGGNPWSMIADDMVHNEGTWKWAVWAFNAGGPELEFRPWSSNYNTWHTNAFGASATAIADIHPVSDAYAQVRVRYRLAGHDQWRTITKPTASSGLLGLDPPRIRTFTVDLKNGMKDDTKAAAVATRLASEWGTTQYGGTLTLSYASDGSSDRTAFLIKAGDTIAVADYPGGAQTFRIASVEADETRVVLGLGRRPIYAHRRKPHKDRWYSWDHGYL